MLLVVFFYSGYVEMNLRVSTNSLLFYRPQFVIINFYLNTKIDLTITDFPGRQSTLFY